MAAIAEFKIENYPIFYSNKGYYEDIVNLIFSKKDFTTFTEFNEELECEIERNLFQSTVQICKDRIELFGLSYEKIKADFELKIQSMAEEEHYDFLKIDITYEDYLKTIKEILTTYDKPSLERNQYKYFKDYLIENDFCIDEQKYEFALWSILHISKPDSYVEYDLTDIIESGWTSDNPIELVKNEKIIILTEGKTDTEFISICIEKFFPHLEDFFHFMDFENSKYEASASRLVHTIKSFVGSGINNKIIALFDNDSAAHKEIDILKKVKLPNNIKVLNYPNIGFAENYPTIGPTGIQNMNINGLAGSIEIYLGKDCLIKDGNYIPIQWTGFVQKISKYQGVIMEKEEIQKKFREKVKNFDPKNIINENWVELISIIELIKSSWK